MEERLRKLPALPKRLHVFDCSMANCFGLKILYSYLNIPFLELKKTNLEQALRVLEEEATATDSDLVNLVKNANYDEYLEHLSKKSGPSRSAPQATQLKASNEESIVPATESNNALPHEGKGKQALPRNKNNQSSVKKENNDNPQENRGEVLATGSTLATESKGNRKAKLEMKHKLMDSAPVAVTTGLADEEREPTDVEDAIRFLNERRSNNELEAFFSDEEEEDGIKAKEDHSNHQEVDEDISGADEGIQNSKQKSKRDHHTASDLVSENTQDEESDDEFYAPQRFGLVASTPAPTEESTSLVANEDSIPSEGSPQYTSELTEKWEKEPELAEQAEVDEENEDNENEIKAVAEEEAGSKHFDESGSITVKNIGEVSTLTNDRAVDNTGFIPMPDDPNIMGDWLDDEGSNEGEFDEALQTPQEAPLGDETADDEAPVDNSHSIDDGEETLNAKNRHIPLNPDKHTDTYSNASGDSDAVTDQGSDNSAEHPKKDIKRSMRRQDTDRDVRTETTVSAAALAAIQAAKIAAEGWEAETPPTDDGARGKEKKKKKKKEKRKDENGIGPEKVKKKKESKKDRKSKEA